MRPKASGNSAPILYRAAVTTSPPESLGEAARTLLENEYRVEVARLAHLATHSNILYRIDLTDGRRLVLRVGQPASNTRSNLDLEVEWLSTLVGDTALNLAEPIPAANGRRVVELAADGAVRSCVLFTWVPGEPMGEGAGTSGYRAMGRVSALLHGHGDWRPSRPEQLRRWDRTFYYPDELERVVIDDFGYDHMFKGLRPVLNRTAEAADTFIARRWAEEPPMVVHGDLHEWNVHLYMGRAWAIDFEDVMLALPAQDIATSLYGARTRPDLEAVIEAFRRGYEEHREWPVRDHAELEVYWSARQAMLMNHAVQVLSEKEARNYFDKVLPWLNSYRERTPSR
jgi:Ser/Thr protein kinase RdoA (MazF antagonist)